MSVATTDSASSTAPIAVYLYAGDQIIEEVIKGFFYYQDSLGNTSHVTDAAGNIKERYTYSAFGRPSFYNAAGTLLPNGSNYNIRHLFHGQLWTQETGLNDHRNRQALPAMGVFLQPDPLGFGGGDSNLYRYCANNPVNRTDPFGLQLPLSGTPPTYQDKLDAFALYVHQNGIGYPTSAQVDFVNATNSVLGSPGFRLVLGVGEILLGMHAYEGAGLTLEAPWFSLPLGLAGTYEVTEGSHDIMEAFHGEGLEAYRERYEYQQSTLTLNYLSITSSSQIGSWQLALARAVGGAIDAVFNAAATYGPGVGYVTVTDSRGTRVVFAGNFQGGPYGGFAPGTPGYYAHMSDLLAEAGLYLSFMGGGQPGEGFHPVSPDLF
jgi:RHS repeat-associated protein